MVTSSDARFYSIIVMNITCLTRKAKANRPLYQYPIFTIMHFISFKMTGDHNS